MGPQGSDPGIVAEIGGKGRGAWREVYKQVIGADTLNFPCPDRYVERY